MQYTKKKPVLSYELFFKDGGEGGIDSLRSPCGQPAHCVHGLSNWLSPVVEPRSGLLIPRCVKYTKKSPYLRTSSSLNMAVRGGIDSLRSPCGQPAHCVHGLSNWLSPVVDPRSGLLIPRCVKYTKKSPYLRTSSSLNMAVRGGIDSLRSPCGQPAHCVHGLSNWLSPVVDPRSGLLIPPVCAIYEKKARTFVRALL